MSYNFVADSIHTKKLCSRLSSSEVQFNMVKAALRFEPPWGGLGAPCQVNRLIRKLVVDFLLVLIELFSLGVTAEVLQADIDRKSAFPKQLGQFDPKFQV